MGHIGIYLYALRILISAIHISGIEQTIDTQRFIQHYLFVLIIGHWTFNGFLESGRFEKFVRPRNITIADYVIKFERLYFKAKWLKTKILGILAYSLLNSARLSREKKQLVKATISKMDHNTMKNQLRKVFTNNAGNLLPKNNLSEENIKVKASDDVYYAKEYNKSSHREEGGGNFIKISNNKH